MGNKILQKICAMILLCSFSLTVTNASLTYDKISFYTKEVILAKKELQMDNKFSKLIPKIDKIFEKIQNNKEKLEKLQKKLNKIETTIYKSGNIQKYSRQLKLINYLYSKNALYIYKINLKEKENEEKLLEKKLNIIKNPTISKKDKKIVENKIINIQNSLLNTTKSKIEILKKDYTKLSNYEETGNLKMNFDLDQEIVGKIKSEIELNNYIIQNSTFDSKLSGELKALFNASLKGKEELKIEFNTFIDFISKDGNLYLLLNKLNIINESNDKRIKEAFSNLKEIASKNKYIKFEDKTTKEILKQIKNIDISKVFDKTQKTLEKPLFTAYKKENNKYYLIPTKYACDKYKELSARFDPWNGNTCSQDQYEKMLKELAKTGDITLEIGNKNKLSFKGFPEKDVKSFNSEVIFTDNNIESINSKLIAKDEGQGFELNYIKNNKLDFKLNNGENLQIDLKSKLDKKNYFSFINFIYSAKGYKNTFDAKLKLENKNITGLIEQNYSQYVGYDSVNYKSKYEKHNLSVKISGKQNYKRELQDLNIKILGKNNSTNSKTFDANFIKNNSNYSLEIKSFNKNKKQFTSNIKLQNKNISGATIIFDKDEKEYIKITNSGKYDTNFLELNNKLELAESPLKSLYGYTYLAKNAKVNSDLSIITNIIEIELIKGTFTDLNNLKLTNNKINFNILKQNKLDFKHPNGDDYLIFIKDNSYQIFGYKIDENGDKIAIIKGNYYQKNKNSPKSLVKINGKIIINGDIIGKDSNFKKTENPKVEANINIGFDARYNKNNFNLFINYIEGKKKILEMSIENKGTIEYKKVEIKTPTNIIDANELEIGPKY